MSRSGDDDDDAVYYESFDRISSFSSARGWDLNSVTDEEERVVDGEDVDSSAGDDTVSDRDLIAPVLSMGMSSYEIWLSEPVSSVEERRLRLLKDLGLSSDPALTRAKCGRSISSDQICSQLSRVEEFDGDSDGGEFHRSRSEGNTVRLCDDQNGDEAVCASSIDSNVSSVRGSICNENGDGSRAVLNKPPSGRGYKIVESALMVNGSREEMDVIVGSDGEVLRVEEAVLRIKNLDNGKEFVVNGVREDGVCSKVEEVGTGKQLTMEEFDICAGHSPIVQELMRRHNVEEGVKEHLEPVGSMRNGLKSKKRGSWLKNLRNVTNTVSGNKDRRSNAETDALSDRGGRRSSSATDDSQDVVFHGPERVRVRQNGKSSKELSALYKSQEICAHNGSIWSIKFSLDGRYLASAGEDCVIHVWQVVGSDRKGELLTDDIASNGLFWTNGSPEPSSSSPVLENTSDKKRRSRTSLTRKSLCLDNIYVPETVFALSDKPFCSFQGHTDDVLGISWSKSQVNIK